MFAWKNEEGIGEERDDLLCCLFEKERVGVMQEKGFMSPTIQCLLYSSAFDWDLYCSALSLTLPLSFILLMSPLPWCHLLLHVIDSASFHFSCVLLFYCVRS